MTCLLSHSWCTRLCAPALDGVNPKKRYGLQPFCRDSPQEGFPLEEMWEGKGRGGKRKKLDLGLPDQVMMLGGGSLRSTSPHHLTREARAGWSDSERSAARPRPQAGNQREGVTHRPHPNPFSHSQAWRNRALNFAKTEVLNKSE